MPSESASRRADRSADILYGPDEPALLREEILADLLEATARAHPDRLALVEGDASLTYAELDRRPISPARA
jgi:non-ribosomal peptide synthetase component F